MRKYVCDVCGWIYDLELGNPDSGIPAGTPYVDIPEEWGYPECGVDKYHFSILKL